MSKRTSKRSSRKGAPRSLGGLAGGIAGAAAGMPSLGVRAGLGAVIRKPVRLVVFTALVLAVWALLARYMLPFVAAPTDLALAAWANPRHTATLTAKAERVRGDLLALVRSELEAQSQPSAGSAAAQQPKRASTSVGGGTADTMATLPRASVMDEQQATRDILQALQGELRDLATRIIAIEPLNATAYRMLGELAVDQDEARRLMGAAVARSRREFGAVVWLLNDAVYRNDHAAALAHADALLRAAPRLSNLALAFIAQVAAEPDGRAALVALLAREPDWRHSVLASLPSRSRDAATPLAVLTDLANTAAPPTDKEVAPLIDHLIGRGLVDFAYDAWLRFRRPAEIEALGLITNPGFDAPLSGLAFDWRIGAQRNAVAEIVARQGLAGTRALHISFGNGRVRMPEVTQYLLLPAGRYRISGHLRGSVLAKRGLVWQLRCAGGNRATIGQTPMLTGIAQTWRAFSFEAEVPAARDGCNGQQLRLFHDARSASEEFISGEIWFDDIQIVREELAAGPAPSDSPAPSSDGPAPAPAKE